MGEDLPITPLHYPMAYVLYKLNKRLSLPGVAVGSIFPDLEIPFMFLIFKSRILNRLVLHSLLGASTLGTALCNVHSFYLSFPDKLPSRSIEIELKVSVDCHVL